MVGMIESKYILAPGTQVREEDFGLLFYTMNGPRLYFISTGELLDSHFFQGQCTLDQWIQVKAEEHSLPDTQRQIMKIRKALHHLREKGVIHEC